MGARGGGKNVRLPRPRLRRIGEVVRELDAGMFLEANKLYKDGKAHFSWGLMENARVQLDLTLHAQPLPKGFTASVCTSQTAM